MEILYILLVIVIIVMIASLRRRLLERMDGLEKEIGRLRKDLQRIPGPAQTPVQTPVQTSAQPAPAQPNAPKETETYTPPSSVTQPHNFQRPPVIESPSPSGPGHLPAPSVTERAENIGQHSNTEHPSAIVQTPDSPLAASPQQPARLNPPAPPKPGFFEKYPDLEKFIGENLVSKIGIAILVLAIGFFVKYAIDNGWIGAVGRICIGLLCGGILVGLAHFLRNNYKAFSSVLVGGGLAVFYFTIALAYHEYHQLGQTAAFIVMLVITSFAVILSLLYDRQELAIIALAGGFLSPFLASNGSGNYKVLFIYLLILNTGLLAIAYRKSWRLLNILAFGLTSILFASWLFTLPDKTPDSTYLGGFLFATVFYVLFFVVNILHNIRERKKFIASDFGILLVNTCFYFGLGLYMISAMHETRWQGLFSACMGVFNLTTTYFLFRRKSVDTNILYLLIGITLTFISMTAPIQLHGHYITLFWASESVLLYWLARKSGIRIISYSARIVWTAMLISLFMDWFKVYGYEDTLLPIVFNKGLMTSLYAAICCFALFYLQPPGAIRQTALITGCCLFLIGGMLEIQHQFRYYYPRTDIYVLYASLYGFAWIVAISYAAARWQLFSRQTYTAWLLPLGILTYLVLFPDTYSIQTSLLPATRASHFWAHWASALLIGYMIYRQIGAWRKKQAAQNIPPGIFYTLICGTIVAFLSIEVLHIVNQCSYPGTKDFDRIADVYVRTGLPILWGIASFVFMWLGMRNKVKELRIVSLAIFSITLLKLFLYDIRNIPIAGKIAAFFCLGVLLLVVSFMYQRLKKIIIEDEEKKNI